MNATCSVMNIRILYVERYKKGLICTESFNKTKISYDQSHLKTLRISECDEKHPILMYPMYKGMSSNQQSVINLNIDEINNCEDVKLVVNLYT